MGNIVFNDEVGKTYFFGHAEKQRFFHAEKRPYVRGLRSMGGSDVLASLPPCYAMETGGGHLALTRIPAERDLDV